MWWLGSPVSPHAVPRRYPDATSLRGPQGVWIQNGELFIADTMNDRVLIYNSIPTANGAAADIVLGQPNMTTWVQVNIADQNTNAAANNMLTPVSVTSDGTRLFVTDLGYNRDPDLEYPPDYKPAARGRRNRTAGHDPGHIRTTPSLP